MDQFETPAQIMSKKRKGRNNMWTSDMDKFLIEGLVQKANEGLKCDKGFKEIAYVQIAKKINKRFDLCVNKDNIVNRLKTIKHRFRLIEEMLYQNGFSWNSSTQTVECSDEVWETYVEAHPKVKNMRYKPVHMMEELKIICGNDATSVNRCSEGPESIARRQADIIVEDIDPIQNEKLGLHNPDHGNVDIPLQMPENSIQVFEGNTQMPESSTQVPTSSSRSASSAQPPPRKCSKPSKNVQGYADILSDVVKSIHRVAEAIERKNMIEERKATLAEMRATVEERKSAVDPAALFQALQEIEMTEGMLSFTFENLLADPIKAKAFMTYPITMRKGFVMRNFGFFRRLNEIG